MKLAFLVLLLVNLALLAWQRGVLGPPPDGGREPQRLERQIAPEKVRVLTAAEAAALHRSTAGAGNGGASASCLEFGDFDEATAARVQARLAALALGERLQARRVEAPGWFFVYLPPLASRAEAERAAQELRGRGLRDVAVMGENSALANGLLLGSFRERETALRQQEDLVRRGVKEARVTERATTATATRFEIHEVGSALARELAEIQKEFAQGRLGACER